MDDTTSHLRKLRERAEKINATLLSDLRPFLATNGLLFRRLPDSDQIGNSTTTCSCLIAMSTSQQVPRFFKVDPSETDDNVRKRVANILKNIVESTWTSSGLLDGNAFTSLMILRSAGLLLKAGDIPVSSEPLKMQHTFKPTLAQTKVAPLFQINETRTMEEVLEVFAERAPKSFEVEEYPSTSAMAYWFIDAVEEFGVTLPPNQWEQIISWAAQSFARQVSLTVSRHDSLKDPVELAMAACLSDRLRRIAAGQELQISKDVKQMLPSEIEVLFAIIKAFRYQEKSGIWPKYFPLFNYREGGSGSNYFFSFELLEVIIHEFGRSKLMRSPPILEGLERALWWCESNRLVYKYEGTVYTGWNSGGQIRSLKLGKPESWATAMVHIFLHKLRTSLSVLIKDQILSVYRAVPVELVRKDSQDWDKLVDSPVKLRDKPTPTSVKALIEEEIINLIHPQREGKTDYRITHCRSALLFGPPGTSKTSLVRSLATKIGWPLVELNPSDFLRDGLENIYSQANDIFNDLRDLWKTVVFFDEMDALAQKRAEGIDVTRQFLTTSMLPKLSMLHDEARVLFFMATNHQRNFDDAIKRPGRFDLLICMAPPSWIQKTERLDRFWSGEKGNGDVPFVREILTKWVPANHRLVETLDLFTFGEFKSFLESVRNGDSLRHAIGGMSESDFLKKVEEWGENHILLRTPKAEPLTPGEISLREEYEFDKQSSAKQCTNGL